MLAVFSFQQSKFNIINYSLYIKVNTIIAVIVPQQVTF